MSDSREATQLVYIAAVTHSGSTLLDLLLGSHSQLASLGELKVFSHRRTGKRSRVLADRCTCGAPEKLTCRFWKEVDERLRAAIGTSLEALDLDPPDTRSFIQNNRALLECARETAETPWLVDSSKSPRRLRRLLRSGAFDIHPIHLTRSPYAVSYSHVRKGRSTLAGATRYAITQVQLEMLLARAPHLRMRYEDLARTPAEEVRHAVAWLGLDFESAQLEWTAVPHHNICGNHMRFSSNSRIQLDDAWRGQLSLLQKGAIRCMTWPARLSAQLATAQSSRTSR